MKPGGFGFPGSIDRRRQYLYRAVTRALDVLDLPNGGTVREVVHAPDGTIDAVVVIAVGASSSAELLASLDPLPAPGSSHAGNAARSSDSPAAGLSPSGNPMTRAGAGVEGVE